MKNLILLTFFMIIASFANAKAPLSLSINPKDITAIIIDRNHKFKPTEKVVVLSDLESSVSFEGKYFKVVLGKSNEAIKFTDSAEINLKAATAYYHLTKAKKFFVASLGSEHVKSMKRVIVRIDITNKFSELGHFANDNLDPQYNNALSIHPGVGMPDKGVEPWDYEIWFRPKKRINIKEVFKFKNTSVLPYKSILKSFRSQMHMTSLNKFLISLLNGQYKTMDTNTINSLMRLVGSTVLLEAGYQGIDKLSMLFSRKWYHLDTALVPEIIYHEFSHIGLADGFAITHSTPVNEGMADYFAGVISNSPKLALKIKKYNTFSGKNAKRKLLYRTEFEKNENANSDFVFGLLWSIKHIMGAERGNALIFSLRNQIDSGASVRVTLLESILSQCKVHCKNYKVDRLRLYGLFTNEGF
jgi:hypothetical protein